jgi:hypothetical protein
MTLKKNTLFLIIYSFLLICTYLIWWYLENEVLIMPLFLSMIVFSILIYLILILLKEYKFMRNITFFEKLTLKNFFLLILFLYFINLLNNSIYFFKYYYSYGGYLYDESLLLYVQSNPILHWKEYLDNAAYSLAQIWGIMWYFFSVLNQKFNFLITFKKRILDLLIDIFLIYLIWKPLKNDLWMGFFIVIPFFLGGLIYFIYKLKN